jgi:hypothetical protein
MGIIIKIVKDQIYFNLSHFISLNNTNIPVEDLSFKYHYDIYWRIELIEYDLKTKCCKVKVQDYYVTDIKTFSEQRLKNPLKG